MVDVYIASIRSKHLAEVVERLKQPEVATITIVCNNYSDSEFEEVKKLLPDCKLYRGDNNKGCSHKLQYIGRGKSKYIALCDDDFIYPEDYFAYLMAGCKKYKVVSLHGRILKPRPIRNYYEGKSKMYHCLHDVKNDVSADIIGSGVCMFERNMFKDVGKWFDYIKHPNMTDIYLSYFIKQAGYDLYVLKHNKGWLRSYNYTDSIYTKHLNKCKEQTGFINEIWDK